MASTPTHLFKHRARIDRLTRVKQGTGHVEQRGTIASDIPCRLMPAVVSATSDSEQAAQYEYNATHAIFFAPGVDVKRDDFCVINGEEFEVRGVVEDSENASVYRKALAKQSQAGA